MNENQFTYIPEYSFQQYFWFEGGKPIDIQIKTEFESILSIVAFDINPEFFFLKINSDDLKTKKK